MMILGGVPASRQTDDHAILADTQPLANFAAEIVREELYDDGAETKTFFQIAGTLQSGEELERWVGGEREMADLEGSQILPIIRTIVDLAHGGAKVDYPVVRDALEQDSDRDLLTRIAFREEPEEGPTVDDCLSAFRRRRLTMESKQLRREIGDQQQEVVDRQLTRLQELARQRDALH